MRKFLLLLLLIPLFNLKSIGQAAAGNYAFSTGTNGSILNGAGGQSIDMSSGTTTIIGAGLTNIGSSFQAIGFEFFYMGTATTTFTAATNGAIYLNGTVTAGNSIGGGASNRLGAFVAGTGGNDMGTHASGKVHFKVAGTTPNRVLVVEFLNMSINRFSGTADATFQVRLYETTGIIEYVYGNMVSNTSLTGARAGFSTNSTSPNINTITFSSTTNSTASVVNNAVGVGQITNLHSPTEGSRRYFRFTPPVPAAPASLTATPTNAGTMSLNIGAAPGVGVLGYAIYQSTAVAGPYTYLGSVAAAGAATVNGLNAATTYYYKVYAITEGALSPEATASATTPAAAAITSIATGNWGDVATWSGGQVPSSGDNVTVSAGHTVTINSSSTVRNLTIQGTLTFNATTTNILTVNGDLSVAAGGVLNAFNGTGGREIDLYGNLSNAGTIDLSKANSFLLMLGTTPQTISSAGGTFVGTDGTGTPANTGILRNLYNYNAAGVTINVPLIITSSLYLYRGSVITNNNLTLDNTQTAPGVTSPSAVALNRYPGAQLSGNLNFGTAATYNLTYGHSTVSASTAVTAGNEIPVSGIVNSLTIQNTEGVTVNTSLQVRGTLTMQGNLNLGSNNLTIGSSAASPGTLTLNYGMVNTTGTITRWFGTTTIAAGAAAGIFPIGIANNYRTFGISGTPTAGGTISVKLNNVGGTTPIGTPFTENSVLYDVRTNTNWQVSTANGFTGSMAVRMQASNLGGVTDFTQVNVSLAAGVAPGSYSAGTLGNTDVQANRTGITEVNLNNSFYIAGNSSTNPLPVQLTSFTGARDGKANKLQWITSSEFNNQGFELERSVDGKNFSSIDFMATKAENGISNSPLSYSYSDERAPGGTVYYRLKQLDRNGKTTYSSSIVVIKGDKSALQISSIYPNPAANKISLAITSPVNQKACIAVTNINGQVVKQLSVGLNAGDNYINLDINSLAPGSYFIRMITGQSEIKTAQFIKN